jgi:hypothetical protein
MIWRTEGLVGLEEEGGGGMVYALVLFRGVWSVLSWIDLCDG